MIGKTINRSLFEAFLPFTFALRRGVLGRIAESDRRRCRIPLISSRCIFHFHEFAVAISQCMRCAWYWELLR